MRETSRAEPIVLTYHRAWTSRNFARAAQLLAPELKIEVPINEYETKETFVQALTAFGAMVDRADMLAEFFRDDEGLLLYDMHVGALGTIRIAEHFTVRAGAITRIRQIHDTALIRAAQLG